MSAWSIRRELLVHAPLDVVWGYVGTPSRLSGWWCPPPTVELIFEQRQGGRFEEHYRDAERAYDVKGTVVAYAPRQRLAVRRVTSGSPSPVDLIDITLRREGGHTRVILDHSFEHLPENRRKDMYDLFADRWSDALRRLRDMATKVREAPDAR